MCDRHAWQSQFSECPYGWALPGGVTWPDAARALRLNATLANLEESNAGMVAVWVFYSYVPYFFLFWSTFALAFRRGTRELFLILFQGFVFVTCNLILKNIFRQARPEQSCLLSCGMPSSHSAIAMGLWLLKALDAIARLRHGALSSDGLPGVQLRVCDASGCQHVLEVCRRSWPAWDVFSATQLALVLTAWSLALLPVPFSRVHLGDHTPGQVFAGSAIGFAFASAWWLIARQLQQRNNHRLGSLLLGWPDRALLCHNAALPYPAAEQRCSGSRPSSPDGGNGSSLLLLCVKAEKSTAAVRELEWYIGEVSRQLTDARLVPSSRSRLEDLASRLNHLLDAARVRSSSGLPTQGLLHTPSYPLLGASPLVSAGSGGPGPSGNAAGAGDSSLQSAAAMPNTSCEAPKPSDAESADEQVAMKEARARSDSFATVSSTSLESTEEVTPAAPVAAATTQTTQETELTRGKSSSPTAAEERHD